MMPDRNRPQHHIDDDQGLGAALLQAVAGEDARGHDADEDAQRVGVDAALRPNQVSPMSRSHWPTSKTCHE